MDASRLFDVSVLGTAMTVMASGGTDFGKHCLTSLNGVTPMLKSRAGTLVAGVFAGLASLCIVTAASAAGLPAPGSAGASSQISEDFARTQITRDGYTKLTDLQKTGDGWTAKALEDGKQVSLIVSSIGSVQKQ